MGFLSGGALLGGVLGATGAYLRGQPVAASAMGGAVSGAVSGAVLQEVYAQQQQQQAAASRREEPTFHRAQNPYQTAAAAAAAARQDRSIPRATSPPGRAQLTFRRVPQATILQAEAQSRPIRQTVVQRRFVHGNETFMVDDALLQHMIQNHVQVALTGLRPGGAMHNIDNMSYEQILQAFGNGNDNLGGSEFDIQQLPVVTLHDPVCELPEDCRQCHICLEDFDAGDVRKTLPCWHGFHEACADKWLRTNGSCPVCKHKIGQQS